jgi:colicin import membrane protein
MTIGDEAMEPANDQGPHEAGESAPAKARDWKRWAVPLVALVLGIAIGTASASSDPTRSEEYQALEQDLSAAEDRATSAAERADKVQSDAQRTLREAAEREAELQGRTAELQAEAAESAAREQAARVPVPAPAPEPTAPRPPSPEVSDIPVAQGHAQRSARQYLDVMGFSRDGLVNQLVQFDGYSEADASTAVDGLGVDWNQQAAKSAQQYLDVMGFSRDGLVNQLVQFDKYTRAQAEQGANAVGL